MSKAIVRSGLDAFVLLAYPNANYAASTRLRAKSGEAESFVHFKSPVPKGSTVTSAKLRFRNAVAQTGSVTVSAQRVGASWKARRLTWANNKPGVVGSAASATIVNPTTSDWFEIDITSQLQTIANGAANYGWKITTTFTTLVRLHSLNAALHKPTLVVEWTDKPDKPGMLSPYGGLAVATNKPVLTFGYSDPGGDDALDAVQVQVNPTNAFTDPAFDSGWSTTTDPELDLAGSWVRTATVTTTNTSQTITAASGTFAKADEGATITGTGIPASTTITAVASSTSATISNAATASGSPTATITRTYAGLADGATAYWRVRVRDEAGGISDWSDVASFSRDDKGTLTMTSPAASPSNFVEEFTPPIAWTYTGETQKFYQVRIARAANPSTWIYDSGKVKSTLTSHTLPFRWHGHRVLRDDLNYIANVRVWDTKDRIATVGIPVYSAATRTFLMNYDATVDPVTSFTATQPTEAPWVRLQFNRATMPDEWVIIRDGEVIDKIDTAADLFVSGTTYRYTDYMARPFVAHTYKVKPVVNHKTASSNPTATITPTCPGFWLIDPDRPSLEVNIGGTNTQGIAYGEDSQTLIPIGAETATQIVAGLRGLEGSFTGPIETTAVRTWDAHKANLLALKATPTQIYRLAFGDENIPVVLRGVNVVPHPDTLPAHMKLLATVGIEQAGDLPFDPVL